MTAVTDTVWALGTQVKPRFSGPAVGMAALGGFLGGPTSIGVLCFHAFVVGIAIYVAHLRDGYVDYYVRGEDDENPLSLRAIRWASLLASGVFVAGTAVICSVDLLGGLLTAVTLALAWAHAAGLDLHPVSKTFDYPVGIACVVLAGYRLQQGTTPGWVVLLAAVYVFLLAGLVVLVDLRDVAADRRVGKRTVPVVLGRRRTRDIAAGAFLIASALVISGAFVGLVPLSVALVAVVPAGGGLFARVTRFPFAASAGATYLFTAAIFLAHLTGSL